jgi:uncharacterized protein with PQ loop repeat
MMILFSKHRLIIRCTSDFFFAKISRTPWLLHGCVEIPVSKKNRYRYLKAPIVLVDISINLIKFGLIEGTSNLHILEEG